MRSVRLLTSFDRRWLVVANAVCLVVVLAWLGWLSARPAVRDVRTVVTHVRTVVIVRQGPKGPVGARGPAGRPGRTGRRGPAGARGQAGQAATDFGPEISAIDRRLSAVEGLCGHRIVADLRVGVSANGSTRPLGWTWVTC